MFVAFTALLAGVVGLQSLVLVVAVIAPHASSGARVNQAEIIAQLMKSPRVMLGMMVGTALFQVPLALVFGRPRPWSTRLLLGRPPRFWGNVLLLALAAIAVAEVNAVVIHSLGRDTWGRQNHDVFLALAKQPGLRVLLVWVGAVVLAPLGEELFFRGLLQPRFVARWGVVPGIFTSAALFGLMHLSLSQSFNAFGLGLVLGWGAWRCRSIWPGVAAHAVVNAVAFTNMRFLNPPPKPNIWEIVSTLALAFALFAAAVALSWRWRSESQPASAAPRVVE
jgi:membrane protease YdiL (CAAX protease family)